MWKGAACEKGVRTMLQKVCFCGLHCCSPMTAFFCRCHAESEWPTLPATPSVSVLLVHEHALFLLCGTSRNFTSSDASNPQCKPRLRLFLNMTYAVAKLEADSSLTTFLLIFPEFKSDTHHRSIIVREATSWKSCEVATYAYRAHPGVHVVPYQCWELCIFMT